MPDWIAKALARRSKVAVSEGPQRGGAEEKAREGRAPRSLIPAAVLVPLFEKRGELHVLLTRRTEEVRSHRGQISFPGGTRDAADRSLLETALRECEEEIGVPESRVRVLGELDDIVTVTDYLVTPYVGLIPYPHPLRISEGEIAEIIKLPINAFLRPERLRVATRMEYRGEPLVTYFFDIGPHIVWGATAKILIQLLEIAFEYRPPTV